MRIAVSLVALVLLARPAFALDRDDTIMEVRVYFDAVHRLGRLEDLAGELDVLNWHEEEDGGWLLIDTDKEELVRIQSLGYRIEVAWPDIRDKFRLVTGVDPTNPEDGRNFGYFLTYWEMQDTPDRLVANFPDLCQEFSAGLNHQGRPLWCLRVSDDAGVPEGEPACFINAATHAREPMGTHCCIAFASQLLSLYGTDSVATWLVNNRQIDIIPVMNPDGYVYNTDSGGSTVNWRKNRRVIQAPSTGVDLNRNYGYKWATTTGARPASRHRKPIAVPAPSANPRPGLFATSWPRTGSGTAWTSTPSASTTCTRGATLAPHLPNRHC